MKTQGIWKIFALALYGETYSHLRSGAKYLVNIKLKNTAGAVT